MSSALAPRFKRPINKNTLDELLTYQAIIDAEVERVARVCAYWKREVMKPAGRKLKVVR